MKKIIFAGIFALSASTSLAQTKPTPAPMAREAETAVPADPAAAPPADARGPVNLCQELLAFMKAPPPEAAGTASAKPAAEAKNAPAGGQNTVASTQGTATSQAQPSTEKKAEASENSAPASGKAVQPKSPEKTGSAQDISGQGGPAHAAPEPNSKPAAQGNVQNAPQTSGLSAPVPKEPTSTPKESVMAVTEAQTLVETNDIAACQGAAKELRRAGVAMPPPLLALTALDLKYHQAGAASPQTPHTQEPAAQPPQ
jgi:hypothetical protein